MLSYLLILSILSVIEFQPSDVGMEYSRVSETEITIILGISSLREQQSIIIRDESLMGSNRVWYPIELLITVEPVLAIDILVSEISPFVPSRIIQVEDMLCGSTTLNNPCIGKKTLCCVDLYKGVNYFRCYSSAKVRYRRYEWGDISSIIGFNIHLKGIAGQDEYKLLNPEHSLITQIDNLRLNFSFRADSSVEGVLSSLQNHAIIQTSDSESIDSLRVLFGGNTLISTEDEWINKSSCYVEADEEFNLARDTIELSQIVGSEYSGFLSDNVIHLVGDLDMIFYLTISASK
ncbi:Hypothetical protein GLP15_190 [Giardia lamblia P15]|uniref:Uncharacterized protein n=1 Tax=Giardia intestinalis (strain P15) TaxID=658858 RepID=E1F3H5_GIAIA|nr:Hypothetical protein GLP15_190 [Giardia lamblia P15]